MTYTPSNPAYADPLEPARLPSRFMLDIERVARVITDPQADLPGEHGAANAPWSTEKAFDKLGGAA